MIYLCAPCHLRNPDCVRVFHEVRWGPCDDCGKAAFLIACDGK